jgi:hypothetical protein
MKGFYISKLSVEGQGMKKAQLTFMPGANVIKGPSDTGKSYIFSVLNYGLGRSALPKDIDESVGYTDVLIEIVLLEDDPTTFTLCRAFGKNTIAVKQSTLDLFHTSQAEKKTYKTSGTSLDSADHISSFLLKICGLDNKRLLKNKTKGKTENLGISTLLKFSFIHEDVISTERSPFYFSGGDSNYIKDQSFLNLLLTGKDYSEIEEKVDDTIKETKISAKREFISSEISRCANDRERLASQLDVTGKEPEQYKRLIDSLNAELDANLNEASEISELKTSLLRQKETAANESKYTSDLVNRFLILKKQYESDFGRLEFILEADSLSSQLGDSLCPICSSPLNNEHLTHISEVENFRASASFEMKKISEKLKDLTNTILPLEEKLSVLTKDLNRVDKQLLELENRLTDGFAQKLSSNKANLDAILSAEKISNQIAFIDDEIKRLYKESDRLASPTPAEQNDEIESILSYVTLSDLAGYIEKRLKKWQFEKNVSVVFDSHFKVFDIIISGKSRRSSGKGKKAISFSAAILGTMDFCIKNEMPFSNLIILDSPLTSFEDKKKADLGPNTSVEEEFFKDLASTSKDCQIIILDHKAASDIKTNQQLNTQIFSGIKGYGRAGFFD